tara:strand:+ start:633 stop:1622 length:990 start_codon:yes stop_codon:yes gene_type:complete
MKQKILVTGCCGLIGSNFTNKLLDLNYDLVLIDNFSTGFKKNLNKIKKKAKFMKREIHFYKINLLNEQKLHNIFLEHEILIVFHFAAFSNVNYSKKNPKKFILNNVQSTEFLLKKLDFFNIKYFIFSSSAAVYGNAKFNQSITEKNTLNPISAYGKSKKICENKIIKYSKNYNLKYCIFRYFNVIGKDLGNNILKKKNLNLFENLALSKIYNKIINIYGKKLNTKDGTPVRDYITVEDLIDAHLVCLKKLSMKKFWNNIYNIGYNNGFSVLEVILEHNKIFKKKIRYKFLNSRKGEISRSVASNKKFLNVSNWKPKMINLKEIIIFFFK